MAKAILICVVFIAVASVVLADKKADMQQAARACMEETRVSEAELQQFFMSEKSGDNVKDNVKCHLKCMMEKQGHFRNGALNEQAMVQSLKEIPQLRGHDAEIERAVADCKNERGANDCDTAFKINMCMKDYKKSVQA